MKNLGKLALLGAVIAASAQFASAASIPVTGSLSVVGFGITPTSTGATFSGMGIAGSGTGSLAAANGDVVTLPSTFTFTSPDVTLFLANGIGNSASFTITGPVVETTTAGMGGTTIYDVTGTGNFNESVSLGPLAGTYGQTNGTFDLSYSSSGGSAAFEITSNVAAAPEPNSLMLLGTGLLSGAGMLIRKRRTA
jgi:hypothetical protein